MSEKIKRIIVEKLFGLDDNDFDIECFPDEYVTILYAFNGIGKTTLLRLLDAVLSIKMHVLDSIPFKKVQVIFDNDDFVLVEKLGDYKKEFVKTKCENLFFLDPDTPVYPIKYTSKKGEETRENYLRLSESFAIEVKKSPKMTVESIKEVDPLKSEKIKESIRNHDENVSFDYLNFRYFYPDLKVKDGVKPVDGLIFENYAFVFFDIDDLTDFEFSPPFNTGFGYTKLMLANKQFKELDPVNPPEKIKYNIFTNYPPYDDNDYFTEENLNYAYVYANLVKKEGKDYSNCPPFPSSLSKAIDLVSDGVFLRYRFNRTEEVEELELKYYLHLINDNFGFMYKNLKLDKNTGLKVVPICDGDPDLDVWQLSSGEKNLIILFYDLLFDSASIVFIDEPEASLHISWQSKLIKNILEVCKRKSIQAIVATHSPDVIDEYEGISTEMISKRYKYGDKYFEN